MSKQKKTAQIIVRVTEQELADFKRACEVAGGSMSKVIRTMMRHYIDMQLSHARMRAYWFGGYRPE